MVKWWNIIIRLPSQIGHLYSQFQWLYSTIIYSYYRDNYSHVVMGGIENFLYRFLKDKIPRYHGILPYSDFYIFINILLKICPLLESCTINE